MRHITHEKAVDEIMRLVGENPSAMDAIKEAFFLGVDRGGTIILETMSGDKK